VHLAGVAAVEPLAEERKLGEGRGRRDAAEIEPDRRGFAFDVRR
jgi:hypothetical protein